MFKQWSPQLINDKWSPRPKRTRVLVKFYIQKQQQLHLHDHQYCISSHCSQLPCPYLHPVFDSISFQAASVGMTSSAIRRSSTEVCQAYGLPLRSANVTSWSRDRPWSDRALVSWTVLPVRRCTLLLVLSKCRSTVTLSYVYPWALYSVITQAGVTGTWCRVTDMLPIFTDPDEQKIGVAVEPISGKMQSLETPAQTGYTLACNYL